MSRRARAAGLALGFAADALVGDPRRGHPVAAFGRVARAAERRWWADSRPRGAAYTAGLVAGAAGLGWAGERLVRGSAVGEAAVVAAASWSVLGGTSLAREGAAMSGLLREGDLPGARRRLSHLCARDATGLEADELARASVESLAENTSDAVVAPLLWGAVAGAPGLLGYRAVNTLDAMVGYRSPRHQHFGWASARLDDLVNLVPARVAALLATATAWFVGGRGDDAWRVWQRDAAAHPSPNAGPVEAAFAGALGVRLGGVNRYGDHEEDRGVLDGGREVRVRDLRRAVTLSRAVSVSALAVAVVVAAGAGRRRG
ncbi:MAG: cobalamin biosynthesis protein [Oryzihumus sp.]